MPDIYALARIHLQAAGMAMADIHGGGSVPWPMTAFFPTGAVRKLTYGQLHLAQGLIDLNRTSDKKGPPEALFCYSVEIIRPLQYLAVSFF